MTTSISTNTFKCQNLICLVSVGGKEFLVRCGFELLMVSEDPAINYRVGLQPTERIRPPGPKGGTTRNGRDTRVYVGRTGGGGRHNFELFLEGEQGSGQGGDSARLCRL